MEIDQKILAEISQVTRDIEENYPELQKYLDEARITLPEGANDEATMDNGSLKEYLNSLREMVEKYKKQH